MWWIIFLYIVPGIIVTWLFPQFVEFQGGMDTLNEQLKAKDKPELTLKQATALMCFMPMLNILSATLLIYWYLCMLKS